MKTWRSVVAAAVLVFCSGAALAEPAVTDLRLWQRPGFTLYSHSADSARTVLMQAGAIDAVLANLLGRAPQPPNLPLHVLVVRDVVWDRYVEPNRFVTSDYVPGRFAHYVILASTSNRGFSEQAFHHEYAHYFLRAQFSGEYPLWFDEGLAQLVANTEFLAKTARVGVSQRMPDGRWLPMDEFLRVTKESSEYRVTHTRAFHDQAWVLMHRGMVEDRAFGAKIFSYLQAINLGTPIDDAVRASFGMSVGELDTEVRRFQGLKTFKAAVLPVGKPANITLEAGQPVGERAGLELLARLMLESGLNPDRLPEVIAAAKEKDPESASVRVLEIRAAQRRGDDPAAQAAWQALQPQLAEPAVARAAGLASFDWAQGLEAKSAATAATRAAWAGRAFELLLRAERSLPVDAESAWALGMLAAELNRETEFALTRLSAAEAAAPRNPDLAATAALIHERLSQPGPMAAELRKVMSFARTARDRLWARGKLQALQSVQGTP